MVAKFVYLVEGEPYVGTVDDIAKALQESHYAGLDMSAHAWEMPAEDDGDPHAHPILALTGPFNDDDYATVRVEVAGEVATYRVDGRA